MEDQSAKPNPNNNPATDTNKKKKKKQHGQFEFCKVCKLNHDRGRQHIYFHNHKKSLSSFLSRFLEKLSDIRFFLRNPSLLRPEHASRNRLWCVFCDSDIDEVGSSFACGNAINHLAGADHLKNLKNFLFQYGGGMARVDSFRILEADLAKWEKKCKSMTHDVAGEGSHAPLIGPPNDIHNDLNSEYIYNFDKSDIPSLNSAFSNGVVPLQTYTIERYQVSHSEFSRIHDVGALPVDANSYRYLSTRYDTSTWGSKNLKGYLDGQQSVSLADDHRNNGGMYQVYQEERKADGKSISEGLQNLTEISFTTQEDTKGNVHSGAPPPWFNSAEGKELDNRLKSGLKLSSVVSPLAKLGKSSKLNPKRVGAAWAERRKVELEMEKRGEFVSNNVDANWLPNFGRVWQSGSRKESRKEFESESKNPHAVRNQTEAPVQLQPYVSKRQRRNAGE